MLRHGIQSTLFLAALCAAFPSISCTPKKLDWSKTSHLVVMDELDFYAHPLFENSDYPEFAPERVRNINANTYTRTSGAEESSTYLELLPSSLEGSVLYLPKGLPRDKLVGLSFLYKKSSKTDQLFFRFYKNSRRRAEYNNIESPENVDDSGWQLARLDLRSSKFKTFDSDLPVLKNLEFLEENPEFVYGLEFGILSSAPNQSLLIDKILLHYELPETTQITGKVVPFTNQTKVFLRTPEGGLVEHKVNEGGEFFFELPSSKRFELFANHEGRNYLSSMGRYLEMGTYLPPLTILAQSSGKKPHEKPKNHIPQRTQSTQGITYEPNSLILYSDQKKGKKQHFFTESGANQFGYIDRSRRLKNPDHAYRVVFVGACYAAGQQVSSQEIVHQQAQSILDFTRLKRPVEVISASMATHPLTLAYPAIVNYAFQMNPNLVLVNFVDPVQFQHLLIDVRARLRGFDPKNPESHYTRVDPKTGKLVHIPYSSDYRLFRDRAPKRLDSDRGNFADGVDWLIAPQIFPSTKAPKRFKEATRVFELTLREIVELAKKRNIEIGVAFTSTTGTLEKKAFEKDGVEYRPEAFYQLVKELSLRAGASFYDLTGSIQFQKKRTENFQIGWPGHGHWSPATHRLIGQELAKLIEKKISN